MEKKIYQLTSNPDNCFPIHFGLRGSEANFSKTDRTAELLVQQNDTDQCLQIFLGFASPRPKNQYKFQVPRSFFRSVRSQPSSFTRAPQEHHEETKSGVSASTDSKVVCTFPTQVSSRSRSDFTWSMPRTLGCTHETWTVPSTSSIMPSIRWACNS
jgi:hypothetical protein